jgi:lipoate-protein ligase A
MYALVLSYRRRPDLRDIGEAHRYVLQRHVDAIRTLGIPAAMAGTSDLVLGQRKFSGNSMRCKRDHFLYHGTLLVHFDLPLVSKLLHAPPREPDYRHGRSHDEFLVNLKCSMLQLQQSLVAAWSVDCRLDDWPRHLVEALMEAKYGNAAWHVERGRAERS